MVAKVADFDDVFEIKNTVTATLTINRHVSKLTRMTLAYLAPEIMLENDALPKKGISTLGLYLLFLSLQILGELPWKSVIPLNSDALYMEAMKIGKRPLIDDNFYKLYDDHALAQQLASVNKEAWNNNKTKRPSIGKVLLFSIFFCFHTLIKL